MTESRRPIATLRDRRQGHRRRPPASVRIQRPDDDRSRDLERGRLAMSHRVIGITLEVSRSENDRHMGIVRDARAEAKAYIRDHIRDLGWEEGTFDLVKQSETVT